MPIPLAVPLISAGVQVLSGIFGAGAARKKERAARKQQRSLQRKLTALENSRQAITNPYQDFKDISSLATDLSGMVSNPYANLGVATQAAEMQIEEADIALANTLDTLRATGASAGGATALAQAALQSKKGVSANIEQQEAANEKLRAQGEDNLQRLQMAESQRVQSGLFTEAQRMQDIDVKGKSFLYSEKERRETEQLNRTQAQITGQQQAQTAARQSQTSIIAGGVGALGNIAGSYMGAQSQYNTPLVNQGINPSTGLPFSK